ncbi:hypothetical protein A7P53_04010 [Acinetobacter defluvii]|nr:hypothetical protein [Acinetobacter defluvii]
MNLPTIKNASNGNKQHAFEIFNELLISDKSQANVQYQVAEMYEKGLGTMKDIHKAFNLAFFYINNGFV